MKTLVLALSTAAIAAVVSGCAYRTYDTYGYRYDRYGYEPRYAYAVPADDYYYLGGRRYSCRFDYDSRFCR